MPAVMTTALITIGTAVGVTSTVGAAIVGGAIVGAVVGGVSAAVRGKPILKGALKGGLIGAAAGALSYGVTAAFRPEALSAASAATGSSTAAVGSSAVQNGMVDSAVQTGAVEAPTIAGGAPPPTGPPVAPPTGAPVAPAAGVPGAPPPTTGFDPKSMLQIGAIGGISGAASGYMQGQAAKEAAKLQAAEAQRARDDALAARRVDIASIDPVRVRFAPPDVRVGVTAPSPYIQVKTGEVSTGQPSGLINQLAPLQSTWVPGASAGAPPTTQEPQQAPTGGMYIPVDMTIYRKLTGGA